MQMCTEKSATVTILSENEQLDDNWEIIQTKKALYWSV